MVDIVLPTTRRKAQNYNPRLMILYGKPKSGKSSTVASLDNNLIIDLEDGYRALEVMTVAAKNVSDLFAIRVALEKKIKEIGRFPYKYITIDNATRLEEMALPYAAELYRKTPMGASYGYRKDANGVIMKVDGKKVVDPNADVRQLPNGAGYLYLREALKKMIHMFQPLCETLILICHVKDRQIRDENSENTEFAVDLAGKMSDIICGEADAVGFIYREKNKTIISFVGGDSTIREARPLHLRGRKFVVGESDADNNVTFDMSKIFV